jgi:hypothetical protein
MISHVFEGNNRIAGGTMKVSFVVRSLVLLSLVAVLAAPGFAAERVAQLSEVTGTVKITRADGDAVDEARQMGPRVRNGSVFPGDIVATESGAKATMVFTDGSEVKLDELTSLSVREVDFTKLMAAGEADKPIGRVIQVLAGDIWTHVMPNPEIATEFETPSGVAAVKGTTLTISVEREK